MIETKTEHTSTSPSTTFRFFIFKQCLKKVIGNEKKVIFDIFFKNYQTFRPENSVLKHSYTTLINGKSGEVFSSSTAIIAVSRTVAKTCDKQLQCPITVRRSVHNYQETELRVDRHCRAPPQMFGRELVPNYVAKSHLSCAILNF